MSEFISLRSLMLSENKINMKGDRHARKSNIKVLKIFPPTHYIQYPYPIKTAEILSSHQNRSF